MRLCKTLAISVKGWKSEVFLCRRVGSETNRVPLASNIGSKWNRSNPCYTEWHLREGFVPKYLIKSVFITLLKQLWALDV